MKGHYHESLSFYEPLQHVEGYMNASYFTDMAVSYNAIGLKVEAKDCYQAVVDHDRDNIEARLHLARLYEELGMLEQAGTLVLDILSTSTRDSKRPRTEKPPKEINATSAPRSLLTTSTMLMPRPPRPITRPRASEKETRVQVHTENALGLYLRVQELAAAARNGSVDLQVQWSAAVRTLIHVFKSNKAFYPYDKHMKFIGYSKDVGMDFTKSKGGKIMQQTQSLAGRLCLPPGIALIEGS